MIYEYTCLTYQAGTLIASRKEKLSGSELYTQTREVGQLAFLHLLNRWNAQNMATNPERNGIVHLYVAQFPR